jgi:2'-5' RNA ligase
MRLFVALDIDDNIRCKIARFLEGVREFAPDARWARPETLHVTLKFIGEQPEQAVRNITEALQTIESGTLELIFQNYGFFPGARAPRVFWIGIAASPELTSLAAAVDAKLATLDIPKDEHAFNAHLTLARSKGGSGSPAKQAGNGPNRSFQRLQEKLAPLPAPEFGTMTAHEFFLYQSQLASGGSKYTKLAGFKLH